MPSLTHEAIRQLLREQPELAPQLLELARGEHDRRCSDGLLDEVRDAFTSEASELVEHDELDMRTQAHRPSNGARSATEKSGDAASLEAQVTEEPDANEPLVRHRFDGRPKKRPKAKRIIVLRDRRRGRPPREPDDGAASTGTHGSDPPR